MTKRPDRGNSRVVGWLLTPEDRDRLLERFPPAYERVIAHHVTHGVGAAVELPAKAIGQVVAVVDDGAGLQALVMEIDGSTSRPDGTTYHVTWSLAEGRKAAETGRVIEKSPGSSVERSTGVRLGPHVIRR